MKKNIDEFPEKPYFFKNSKRYPGKSLEWLILNESQAFFNLLKQPYKKGDQMHEHMDFLLNAGNDMEINKICPICGQNPVSFLIFRNCSFLSTTLSCCNDPNCKRALQNGSGDRLISIKLRNLNQFSKKSNQKKAESIIRKFLGIKVSDEPEKIFLAITTKYRKKLADKEGKSKFLNEKQLSSRSNVLKKITCYQLKLF